MSNLLSSGFSRLFKNKLFWWLTGGFAAFGVIMRFNQDFMCKSEGEKGCLDTGFFAFALLIGIALAIFTSLFVGVEYSDGTMRNKLIVGHSRSSVYFSNLIVCTVAGMIFAGSYILASVMVGVPLFGGFTSSITKIIALFAICIVLILSYSSIFVMISMINQNKAAVAIISILLSFMLLFAGNMIYSGLNEPEYYEAYSYTDNGKTYNEPRHKNENYLTGTRRQVYEFLYDFNPGCQSMRIAGMYEEEVNADLKLAGYSLLCFGITSAVGIIAFRKKDLK